MTSFAFLGDSYPKGYLLPDTSKRWPTVYSALAGGTEINLASSGGGFCMQGAWKSIPDQAAENVTADRYFVFGGHNDAESTFSLWDIKMAMRQTFERILARQPGGAITCGVNWHYYDPSDRIQAVAAMMAEEAERLGLDYIDDAVNWRVNRKEWSFDDGHPNVAGADAIAKLVYAHTHPEKNIGATRTTVTRAYQADASFPGYANIVEDTIFNAKAGLWEVEVEMAMHGPCGGWAAATIGGYRDSARHDLTSTPENVTRTVQAYHPGGDLYVSGGYTTIGTAVAVGSGNSELSAQYIGKD